MGKSLKRISVPEDAVAVALRKLGIERCSIVDETKWAFLLVRTEILDGKAAWTEVLHTFNLTLTLTLLVRWITLLTMSGYPPRYETLRRLAEIIRDRRIKTTDGGEVPVKVYDRIGKEWVPSFLRRHSELASVRP